MSSGAAWRGAAGRAVGRRAGLRVGRRLPPRPAPSLMRVALEGRAGRASSAERVRGLPAQSGQTAQKRAWVRRLCAPGGRRGSAVGKPHGCPRYSCRSREIRGEQPSPPPCSSRRDELRLFLRSRSRRIAFPDASRHLDRRIGAPRVPGVSSWTSVDSASWARGSGWSCVRSGRSRRTTDTLHGALRVAS